MRKNQRRNKREIKYLKKEDWNKLRDTIDSFRDMVVIELLYETGCRVGEVAKMEIEDIDFQASFVRIPAKNTKTRTGRTVFIPQGILSKVKAYLKQIRRKKGLLFNLSKRRLQQIVKKYSQKSGVICSAHTLRHTHIVHALQDRVNITAVQGQVGHKRLETTQVYCELAPEQVREAYERRI